MRFLHSFCDGFPQVLNIFFGSLLEISLGIEYGRFYIPTGSLQKQTVVRSGSMGASGLGAITILPSIFFSITSDPQGGALHTDFTGTGVLLNSFHCGTKLFRQYR